MKVKIRITCSGKISLRKKFDLCRGNKWRSGWWLSSRGVVWAMIQRELSCWGASMPAPSTDKPPLMQRMQRAYLYSMEPYSYMQFIEGYMSSRLHFNSWRQTEIHASRAFTELSMVISHLPSRWLIRSLHISCYLWGVQFLMHWVIICHAHMRFEVCVCSMEEETAEMRAWVEQEKVTINQMFASNNCHTAGWIDILQMHALYMHHRKGEISTCCRVWIYSMWIWIISWLT